MPPLIHSGLRPQYGTYSAGHEYSAECLAREAELIRQSEAADPESLDFVDLCLLVGIKPSRIRDMLSGVDVHDEIAVDAAIRTGIHRIVPSLDEYAHYFVRHLWRPLETYAEAAE